MDWKKVENKGVDPILDLAINFEEIDIEDPYQSKKSDVWTTAGRPSTAG